jgi:transcriptional regulator with XRE-family HTH domain
MKEVGNKIKTMRIARRLSQQDLSELTGLSISAIRSYEYGRRKPKQETVKKIMDALMGFPAIEELKEDLKKDGPATVDLALDNVGYKWKHKPLTAQQVSAMRTVVRTMVEPDTTD